MNWASVKCSQDDYSDINWASIKCEEDYIPRKPENLPSDIKELVEYVAENTGEKFLWSESSLWYCTRGDWGYILIFDNYDDTYGIYIKIEGEEVCKIERTEDESLKELYRLVESKTPNPNKQQKDSFWAKMLYNFWK